MVDSPSFSEVWKQVTPTCASHDIEPELCQSMQSLWASPKTIFEAQMPWAINHCLAQSPLSQNYQTKLPLFCCIRDCFPSCPFPFVSVCLFFFSVLAGNSQQIHKMQHSQQQPGFSSGCQLIPTHHCIPAKWWDCDVLKIRKIYELWMQTSTCNCWFNDSLRLYCTFKLWSGAFFLFDFTSKLLIRTTLL